MKTPIIYWLFCGFFWVWETYEWVRIEDRPRSLADFSDVFFFPFILTGILLIEEKRLRKRP